ncbi:MAG: 3-dehydroquinate synthase [Gammaproteobacteria bacterium]|nr:3-dehydroquinate synthase [Gammaproteobacteria bacterium]
MKTLSVALEGNRSYPIHIGSGVLGDAQLLRSAVCGSKVLIVSNATVARHYLSWVREALTDLVVDELLLPDGEAFKTLQTWEGILSLLLERNHGRDTTLIALGGGVIGDMVGFAAACYQRGVGFVQIPTTLLAQVDSSVGGKTAVNHLLGKNMIGAFHQPQAVLIDTRCLATLPAREFAAGMAEVIKYGIIADRSFFEWLEGAAGQLLAGDSEALTYAIERSCAIKARIVAEDETEQGVRALLNLGHTYGHAIEAEQGYGNWLHGEAVAAGMVLACRTAVLRQQMTEAELERVIQLLLRFSLPVTGPRTMDADAFLPHMRRDKKVKAGRIRLVLPIGIGNAEVADSVTEETLREAINDCGRCAS